MRGGAGKRAIDGERPGISQRGHLGKLEFKARLLHCREEIQSGKT